MAIAFKQNGDGSLGLQGRDLNDGEFIPATYEISPGSDSDRAFLTLTRAMRVKAIVGRVDVLNGAALTVVIRKVPSGTAIVSGTALHLSGVNANASVNANQTMTLASATDGTLDLVAGDSLGADLSAANTAAVGNVTVWLTPQ